MSDDLSIKSMGLTSMDTNNHIQPDNSTSSNGCITTSIYEHASPVEKARGPNTGEIYEVQQDQDLLINVLFLDQWTFSPPCSPLEELFHYSTDDHNVNNDALVFELADQDVGVIDKVSGCVGLSINPHLG